MNKLTKRQQAEAIEKFGDDLRALDAAFDDVFRYCLDPDVVRRVNDVPNQEHIGAVAQVFQRLGYAMQRECDEAEDAETLARANPLEPGFRRLG